MNITKEARQRHLEALKYWLFSKKELKLFCDKISSWKDLTYLLWYAHSKPNIATTPLKSCIKSQPISDLFASLKFTLMFVSLMSKIHKCKYLLWCQKSFFQCNHTKIIRLAIVVYISILQIIRKDSKPKLFG